MVEEIIWVINPIEHRKKIRLISEANYEKTKKAYEDRGAFFIDVLVDSGLPDDLWVCDLCNDEIAVDSRIPIVDNLALCTKCFAKWNTEEYVNDKTIEGDCPNVCCNTDKDKEKEEE